MVSLKYLGNGIELPLLPVLQAGAIEKHKVPVSRQNATVVFTMVRAMRKNTIEQFIQLLGYRFLAQVNLTERMMRIERERTLAKSR